MGGSTRFSFAINSSTIGTMGCIPKQKLEQQYQKNPGCLTFCAPVSRNKINYSTDFRLNKSIRCCSTFQIYCHYQASIVHLGFRDFFRTNRCFQKVEVRWSISWTRFNNTQDKFALMHSFNLSQDIVNRWNNKGFVIIIVLMVLVDIVNQFLQKIEQIIAITFF